MIVQCDSCQAKYKIADEKIKGKAVKIRCAKCSHVFTVRPAADGPAAGPAPVPPPPSPPEPSPPEEKTPASAPPGAPVEPSAPAPEGPPAVSREEASTAAAGSAPGKEAEGPIGTYQPPIGADENISFGPQPPPVPEPEPGPPVPAGDRAAPAREAGPALGDIPDAGLPAAGDGSLPFAEPDPGEPAAAPPAEPSGAPSDLDWGNIALDTPSSPEDAPTDLGLAGGDKYQPPPPPPPVPVDEELPAAPFPGTQELPHPGGEPEPAPSYQPETAGRGGGKGLILLVLLLLGLGAGGYFYGFPLYQEWRSSRTVEATVELTIAEQAATAIKRDDGNILSVVRGRIRNDSGKSVGLIEVAATFLGPDDRVLGEASSFCGNQFTDEELRTGDMARIRNELQYELGQGMSNNSIKPGGAVPFLILLENSPLDIKRVTVTIKGYKETT